MTTRSTDPGAPRPSRATSGAEPRPARPPRSTTRMQPHRPEKTAAWTASKLLLFAALVALGAAIYLARQPVVNPGVQECGPALSFFLDNQSNVIIHPGEPGAPPNAVALASQPPCRDLAGVQIQKAGIALAAFFGLGLAGIVLGLVDDRVDYWQAPQFESLLRPMPREARIRHGLEPKVDVEDLGSALPPLETPELWGLGLVGLATFLVLPFAGPLDATRVAASSVALGPILVGLIVVALTVVAASAQRKAVYPGTDSWTDVLELVLASSWVGRLRPIVGAFGIDVHHLRKTGLSRDDAVLDTQVLQTVSLTVHVALLAVTALLVVRAPRPDVRFDTPQLVLLGALVLVVLSSLQRLPRRIRALPVRPGWAGLRGITRVAGTPERLAELAAGTLGVTLGHLVVLSIMVSMVGGDVGVPMLLFSYLAAVTVGSLSTTPHGLGVFEATLALLLMRAGVDPGAAIVATLSYRFVMFWLPMLPAIAASRRMRAVDQI